jgi:uncharacterized protein Usg
MSTGFSSTFKEDIMARDIKRATVADAPGLEKFEAWRRQALGYGLTTAEITYRRPDSALLVQIYVWQDYDIAPKFPVLTQFLDFWNRELDGKLLQVVTSHSKMISARDFRNIGGDFRLN